MQGLYVGHHTHLEHGTGVTVFLFNQPAVAAYCLAGSSPATRELHMLDVAANPAHIDGLVFLGGSALGLGAVDGVVQWLQEEDVDTSLLLQKYRWCQPRPFMI